MAAHLQRSACPTQKHLQQGLLELIHASKQDCSEAAVRCAAAAATILVAAGFSFSGHDLQGVCLRDANLGAGMFCDANLRGADLRKVQLHGAVLDGADLSGAELDGVQTGILPTLQVPGPATPPMGPPEG